MFSRLLDFGYLKNSYLFGKNEDMFFKYYNCHPFLISFGLQVLQKSISLAILE